jgi:hypothetical protein
MRRLLLLGTVLAGTGAIWVPAYAGPIAYQLDTVVSGNTLTPTPSYGTVTYTDSGNSVVLTIDLARSSWKALAITMNFNDAKFGNTGWSVSGDSTTIDVSENQIKADGYSLGMFDIEIPDTGNLKGTEPYSITISHTGSNLDPADFDVTATGGLYNVVHIGNLDDCGDSIWVASHDPVPAPEPATFAFLGLGLTALGFLRRHRT